MLLTVLRRSERSRHRLTTSARSVPKRVSKPFNFKLIFILTSPLLSSSDKRPSLITLHPSRSSPRWDTRGRTPRCTRFSLNELSFDDHTIFLYYISPSPQDVSAPLSFSPRSQYFWVWVHACVLSHFCTIRFISHQVEKYMPCLVPSSICFLCDCTL